MIRTERTNSENTYFRKLVIELDKDLAIRDGDDHAFYAQFNKIDSIKHVIILRLEDEVVGCGAIKAYDDSTMEVKRMFVSPEFRGQGIASLILKELEKWCVELGAKRCILETGDKQHEAIALYHKNKYQIIPNYGQYAGVETSFCFEKWLF
jgi:GNAT superfamily N-acetyltransferase